MVCNINIGVLGHVDSGKTSLTKLLSQVASTAAFDKNPQSQERGITIDLGFSSFSLPKPAHLDLIPDDVIQYTLVDCPGHASLIKTIIGGAQIIDMMLLIVDITKGIQTQTAECLIIGEISCRRMIVVLNKVDLIEDSERKSRIDKMKKKILTALKSTAFGQSEIPIVATSAKAESGIKELLDEISRFTIVPSRTEEGPFLFAVDHCFGIKGQGTVLTGTVLQGKASINDILDIPQLKIAKKVKSIQMFKRPVASAKQGDRVGICVAQFDPKLLERGLVCSPGSAVICSSAVVCVNKVKYYKFPITSKSKLHITIGHDTVMATITMFNSTDAKFSLNNIFEYKDSIGVDDEATDTVLAVLQFDVPIMLLPNSKLIALKLDLDVNTSNCRIAFFGDILEFCDVKSDLPQFFRSLRIYKTKRKEGCIDRIVNKSEVIVKNMFKKQTDFKHFLALDVRLSTGEVGRIENTFGQSGKVKIQMRDELLSSTVEAFNNKTPVNVVLEFKRFIFDPTKKPVQVIGKVK